MKRFYKDVTVAEAAQHDGSPGWRVLLDGRPIRTQAGREQVLPSRALAEALAEEWRGQGPELDTARFVLRDMADHAIDTISHAPAMAAASLLAYGETDTLLYRADPDEPFAQRQSATWDPLVLAAEARHGVSFRRVAGVMHKPQPDATLPLLLGKIASLDCFSLAALSNLASLAASLIVGLAALEPGADAGALFDVANLEEDWQVEQWGEDAEAAERRARRKAAFVAAARFAALARED